MRCTHHHRGLYAPELLEARIAPATFIVNSLLDNGDGANTTLREAIDAANLRPGADTILFDKTLPAGTITLAGAAEILITDTLIIKGPGVDKLAISGNEASRIFRISDGNNAVLHPTTISGLTLRDANFGGSGGAIYSSESLSLTNVVVHSNTSAGDGGGLLVLTSGKVSLDKVALTDNVSSLGKGGGMFVVAEGGILVSKSIVSGNSARRPGGGMYLAASNPKAAFVVDLTSFIDNTSTNFSGGGIALNHAGAGKMTVKNSTFTGNTAPGAGGALLLVDGALNVDRTLFAVNSAGLGGAIQDMDGDSLKISKSRFEGNTATDKGGALHVQDAHSVSVIGSIFTGNDAAARGGAIHTSGGGALSIKSSILSGNTATTNGGAISLAGAGTSLLLASSTVSGNAGVHGGGLFADTGAKLTVTGGVFSANAASGDGGGIATTGTAGDAVNLTVSGTIFQANRAAQQGGGVYTTGDGTVFIKSARVLGNHAGAQGGGMYLRSSAGISVQTSLFQHNVAGAGGGGLAITDVSLVIPTLIAGSRFLDNVAGGDGGGIAVFANGAHVTSIKGSFISGNIAGDEGGGVAVDGGTLSLIASIVTGNWSPRDPNVAVA